MRLKHITMHLSRTEGPLEVFARVTLDSTDSNRYVLIRNNMKFFQMGFLCFFIFYVFPAFAQSDPPKFSGAWEIAMEVPTRGIVGLTQEEANSYLGTKISYSNESATFGDDICRIPNYKTTEIKEDDFFSGTYNSFKELSINGEYILRVELKCESKSKDWFYGSSFYYNDENRLLILIDGVWFELLRDEI